MRKCGASVKPGHETLRSSTSLMVIKTFSQGYTTLCHPRWVIKVVCLNFVCSCFICIIQTHLSISDKNTILSGLNLGKPEEELTDLLRWIKSIRKFHSWKVCIHIKSLLHATFWKIWALIFIIYVTSGVYHFNIKFSSGVFPVGEAKVHMENKMDDNC